MQPLVEKYKPMTIGFAGLDRPRAILSRLAADPYPSAWLLLGPSGLGKTTMALAIARQIGGEVHHIPSRQCDLETVARVTAGCHYAPMFGEKWHVILVDEADQMTRPAQLAFLSKLDTTAAPPNTIFLFTANSTKLLEDRFVSRCRAVKFSHDGLLEPVCKLLAKIWKAETAARAPDFAAIVRAAGFNVRQAIMNLELEMIAPGSSTSIEAPPARAVAAPSRHTDPRIPPAGTVLVREFQGRQITVHVTTQGFQFEDRQYASLSAIAREATQGNRNGYTFFRLGAAS